MKLKDPKKVPQKLEEEVEFHTNETVIVNDPSAEEVQDPDIFYFSNTSNQDWTTQWNKVRYTFPANKTVRLFIKGESPENVQSIRKMFAYRFAQEQVLKSDTVKNIIQNSKGAGGTYDEKLLQPFIDACLKPLAKAKLSVTETKDNPEAMFKASKAVSDKSNLNYEFKDDAEAVVSN